MFKLFMAGNVIKDIVYMKLDIVLLYAKLNISIFLRNQCLL
jgi:hypothetical protein